MGSGSSKPADSSPTHVWKTETPVIFSPEMTQSLQSSNESDSTRAKILELHIQARVASELKKLQEKAAKEFEEVTKKISSEEPGMERAEGDQAKDLGRESVENDVLELRKKLQSRKRLAQIDEGVEKAKSEVVRCLRENDRRPLDCWKEVQTFREEVRRLESVWVEKIVR